MDCKQEFESYDDVDTPCPYGGYKGEHNFPLCDGCGKAEYLEDTQWGNLCEGCMGIAWAQSMGG